MLEQLKELSQMQQALDASIENEYGLVYGTGKYNLNGLKRALHDELGELNHEDKASWCWWKKNQKEVDRDNLLEELVDCWHFALSIDYHENEFIKLSTKQVEVYAIQSIPTLFSKIIKDERYVLENMFALTLKLGFTWKDVYEAYKKKNQVNYERLRNNY